MGYLEEISYIYKRCGMLRTVNELKGHRVTTNEVSVHIDIYTYPVASQFRSPLSPNITT